MSDQRHDYGPAGCLDGCAESGGCGCLLTALTGLVLAVFAWRRPKKKS